MERSRERFFAMPGWLSGICAIAIAQLAAGLVGLVAALAGVEWERPTPIHDGLRALHILVTSSLAAYLLLGSRRDRRIMHLGALFLLGAVFYAHHPIQVVVNLASPSVSTAVVVLRSITVDAFMPVLVWLFFRDFPRALEWPRSARFARLMIGAATLAACLLVISNVALGLGATAPLITALDRTNPASPYWTVVFGLILPALPFVMWRMRHAPEDERRRVRVLALGFAIAAVLPTVYILLPPLSDRLRDAMLSPPLDNVLRPLVQVMILSIPLATTYAVVVQRALEVRTILRSAAQYGLARAVVGTLAAVPVAALVLLLYDARDEPLAALFTGTRPVLVVAIAGFWFLILRIRRRLMALIDRIFLREPYDSGRVLVTIGEVFRGPNSAKELAEAVVDAIEDALHAEASVLAHDVHKREFVPVTGGLRPLSETSELAEWITGQRQPLQVALDRRSPLDELPLEDRLWLADGNVHLVVPARGSEANLAGFIALGAKRSELPFSREDLEVLSAIGSQAGIALELRQLRDSQALESGASNGPSEAKECRSCGAVFDPTATRCPLCGSEARPSPLPLTLLEKYRLERRLGAGAMGVVYLAMDLALGRQIALKTLPATSPENSLRLRREARAMAAITHPNLALIFGAESWRGTPILVIEYLAGGTLADRIATAPLGLLSGLEVGYTLAGVLDCVHRAGLLHRDVKPSNIGYTESGVPKLLDFGLARLTADLLQPPGGEVADLSATETGLVGTPLYLPPEAFDGAEPDASFDLWGIGVVAIEAALGRHPFERSTANETLEAIRRGWNAELAADLAIESSAIEPLFESLLSPDRSRRPVGARAVQRSLGQALAELRPQVAVAETSGP